MKKLLAALLLAVAASANPALAQEARDPRQFIEVGPAERAFLFEYMRALVDGTQRMLELLARDDYKTATEVARQLGAALGNTVSPSLRARLPAGFEQLRVSLHGEYDQIANDIAAKPEIRRSLNQIAETMAKCTACHVSYQFKVRW